MKKTKLKKISPINWEHPADKTALNVLRKLKGFDELVKKVIGVTTEKALRLIHLASSVKVSKTQFARVNFALETACEVFDCPDKPEVYIAQSPFLNAAVLGANHPFMVIQSSTIQQMSDEELLCVVGHELGHILSGHVLYKTLLWLLLNISFRLIQLPFGNLVLIPIILALKEWDRKSELTADRAALLASQDETPNYTLLMKMSGGSSLGEMNVNDFFLQAASYEDDADFLDNVYKLLNMLMKSHPFSVVRLKELKTWACGGQYKKILAGDYVRKGKEDKRKPGEDFKETTEYYKESTAKARAKVKETFDNISDGADKVFAKLGDALKGLFE
jgi:Zn-dependent protease with chaperone function